MKDGFFLAIGKFKKDLNECLGDVNDNTGGFLKSSLPDHLPLCLFTSQPQSQHRFLIFCLFFILFYILCNEKVLKMNTRSVHLTVASLGVEAPEFFHIFLSSGTPDGRFALIIINFFTNTFLHTNSVLRYYTK